MASCWPLSCDHSLGGKPAATPGEHWDGVTLGEAGGGHMMQHLVAAGSHMSRQLHCTVVLPGKGPPDHSHGLSSTITPRETGNQAIPLHPYQTPDLRLLVR